MEDLNKLSRKELSDKAKEVWAKAKRHRSSPLGDDDRRILTHAYWSGVLPKDDDYSLGQWVEDGFPTFL